jgi:hypothetical protein
MDEQPATRIVEMFQQSGHRVALGWAEIAATQQPLLEQWQRQEISAQQLLDQLARVERADWLRRALRPDLMQVALGSPRSLLAKIRAGEALSDDERAQLPKDFRSSADAFEVFVDRVTTSSRLRRYNVTRLYRAHLAAEQTIAENIVRFTRDNPDAKLLVFLPEDLMIDPREIADFAAQKSTLRQMILDRWHPLPGTRPQLLARRRSRGLQIVDRAPESSSDNRRLVAPRLRT